MADKNGSNRYGFNQRGLRNSDILRHAQELSDPDSEYWRGKAANLKHWLIRGMGEVKYYEWAERLFPDGEGTFKELCELYEAKMLIECSCVLPEQHCPVCEEAARTAAGEEIPF